MALSYTVRRRLSLIVLVVGLPVYIVLATSLVGLIERPVFLVELLIYVGLGILWALPLKFLFVGIGKEDPDRIRNKQSTRSED